jgi:high-affinity iron transporter
VVVAAGLFAYSLHELQEAGWLPFLESQAFDVSGTVSDERGVGAILRGLLGYNANPSWLEVVGWLGYLVVIGVAFFRPQEPAPRPVGGSDSHGASRNASTETPARP